MTQDSYFLSALKCLRSNLVNQQGFTNEKSLFFKKKKVIRNRKHQKKFSFGFSTFLTGFWDWIFLANPDTYIRDSAVIYHGLKT